MVTKTNAGLNALLHHTRHVLSGCVDTGIYDSWRARRWEYVVGRLSELSTNEEVASFISSYADSLAQDLLNLPNTAEAEEAAGAAAEYFEELLTQAEFVAETTSRGAEKCGPVPEQAYPDLDIDPPSDWAMAA